MIVTFCGHRKVHAPQEVAIWLNQVCEQLIIGGGTTFYPLEQVPQRYAIIRRNEWCVRQADAVVAYVMCDWGGAAGMLRYARRKKKRLLLYFEENVANHRFVQ